MLEKNTKPRILSIDYGRKRIGLAVCDELHITVTPLDTQINDSEIFEKIKKIIEELNVGKVILGMPQRNDDRNFEFQNEILSFKKALEEYVGINVVLFDESFSSKKAVKTMIEIGKKKFKRREKSEIDKISAAIILKEFLEENES